MTPPATATSASTAAVWFRFVTVTPVSNFVCVRSTTALPAATAVVTDSVLSHVPSPLSLLDRRVMTPPATATSASTAAAWLRFVTVTPVSNFVCVRSTVAPASAFATVFRCVMSRVQFSFLLTFTFSISVPAE